MDIIETLQRYYRSNKELETIRRALKSAQCPHCHRYGYLIFNGRLTGYCDSSISPVHRGQRIFCSNRNTRTGCGKSYSIFPDTILRSFRISATNLWIFLQAIIGFKNIHVAWKSLDTCLSQTTIYRLYQRIHSRQVHLRTMLVHASAPPDTPGSKPLYQTIKHLLTLFASSSCPIADFQHHFQATFL